MPSYDFVTLDVFTDVRFGGNPLAIFPDARGMDTPTMKALSREFNMSEIVFVLPPADPANTARARIFTTEVEIGFAGHPNVGLGWVFADHARDGLLRFEELSGVVEVAVQRRGSILSRCEVPAPCPLSLGEAPTRAELAACATLNLDDILDTALVSVALQTACVEVAPDALSRARCDSAAFRAVAARRPDLASTFLLFVYARDAGEIRARMFAPLSGTIEDPATGSAAAALTAWLAHREGLAEITLGVTQGLEMGRPSRMLTRAALIDNQMRAWVSGSCVPVLRGVAEV